MTFFTSHVVGGFELGRAERLWPTGTVLKYLGSLSNRELRNKLWPMLMTLVILFDLALHKVNSTIMTSSA